MRWACAASAGLLAWAAAVSLGGGDDPQFRESFEGRRPLWVAGGADAAPDVNVHETTTKTAHGGQRSEYIQLQAGQGTYCHYVFSVGRLELGPDLQISLWLKANRPGARLMARLVLPRERDPDNFDHALTVMLRGDAFDLPGRWQKLTIADPVKAAREQRLLLQAEFKRQFNFDAAFIDQIVLNVYGGKGLNEVWIDDLEISPKPGAGFAPPQPGKAPAVPVGNPGQPDKNRPGPEMVVEMALDRLTINKKPFFVRAIRHSDTPLETLRDAGFNTLWVDFNVRDEVLNEAIRHGFWLAPHVPVLEDHERVSIPDGLGRELRRFKHKDAVLFWHVGSGLTAEHAPTVGKAAKLLHSDPEWDRPVGGDIWDGFKPYSRHLDILGMHRWPIGSSLELDQYRAWLVQRTRLAEPGKYAFAWIQTHLPDWHLDLAYGGARERSFNEPIGPHPEQIRLMTYLALSAGCKGVGFWSDRFLANSHHGRDRLLQLGLLNQELEMLEPVLATAKVVDWIDTDHAEVKAAVLRYEGGMLLLPIWVGQGAQYVPGQYAVNNLSILVPGAPEDAQVWEISPGKVSALGGPQLRRAPGGLRITLPEFGLTAAVLFTGDMQLIGDLQQAAKAQGKKAAYWAYNLALEELRKVEFVNERLEQLGHGQPDGGKLLKDCRHRLHLAHEAWAKGTLADYRETYAESQRALRALRILMRASWERAVRVLDVPVSSPYAVSYFTLPQHWQFVDEVRTSRAADNVLLSGGFEDADARPAWSIQRETLDAVKLAASLSADQPKEGRQCLKLEITPDDPARPPAALQRTFLAATSPAVRVHPGALVRISGWVHVPAAIQASVDGVMMFDSIGGEPLAVRLTGVTPWRKFTLYRRASDAGSVSVTVALTGVGVAYFDDIRIEPMFPPDRENRFVGPPAARNP